MLRLHRGIKGRLIMGISAIESMQHSVDLWNKLYLGILLAAALLGILGGGFAGRVVSLTRKLDKTKTEQYQREKQTNDVKIEQAREKASIADENAAKANREA